MAKISKEEYEILKSLGDEWKWIARDKNGYVYIHDSKPHKFHLPFCGGWEGDSWMDINGDFSFIQWEDDEPCNIAELIEEYEKEYQIKNAKIVNADASEISGNASDYEHFYKRLGESEGTEVKNIEWLMQWIEEYESEVIEECKDELKGIVRAHSHGKQSAIKRIKQKIDQLEVLSLLAPKQEDVDRAYKDGYEEGREHGFYKGYREGLADKGGEPETVADVVAAFWKSYERLKEVMSMEVEELEE